MILREALQVLGPNEVDERWPTLYVEAPTRPGDQPKVHVGGGSIMVARRGDPVDIGLRRAGPDNSNPSLDRIDPTPLPDRTNIGSLYWEAYCGGPHEWNSDSERQDKPAQLYTRTTQDQSPTARGCEVVIATCPNNTTVGLDALVIANDGHLRQLRGAVVIRGRRGSADVQRQIIAVLTRAGLAVDQTSV